MIGEGNQNEHGFTDLTRRPPSVGQIIGQRIKARKARMDRLRKGGKPGQMAGMLSSSFRVAAAQSPVTRIPGDTTYQSVPKIPKF